MPTSAEIAQQIQDQQSWFMQQNAMASQIGMSPMAYGGGNVMPGHPGMGPMPRGFSFAPRGGYGAGNTAGAMAGGALGALPMFASVMGGSNPLTNPISGFMAARGMGLGLGASAGAAGLMMAPMALAGAAVGQMVGGAQQQSLLNTATMGGGYNFANASSLSGQGFSRQDSMNIGRSVRQLQMIPELMTSFEEVTKILPQLKNIGVMQGVRDAAEFSKRMKESITTIREVSKILGTTMADATDFFAHSRRVGFFGSQAMVQNAMNAQVTMSATGMNREQVMRMQEQGAAQGTAIGGDRGLGADAVTKISQRLGLQVRGNPAMQATIQNITGQSNMEQGIADAAGMISNIGMKVSGTSAGRFMMAGFMKVGENGEVGLDEELMERHRRGDVSMDQVRGMGMRNMGNRSFVKKFERNQTKLGQQFAGMGGHENLAQMLYGAFGEDEDSAALVMQRQFGFTQQQTELTLGGMRDERSGLGQERRTMQGITDRNTQRRMNSPGGMMQRMGKRMSNTLLEPLKQAGAEMSGAVGSFVDEIYEDMMGDFMVQASEGAKKDFISMLSGNDSKEMAKRAFGGGGISAKGRSFTTSMAESWKNTDMYAFLARGTNDTGRTAEAQFERYRELGAGGGRNITDVKAVWDRQMEGAGAPSGGYNAAETAGAEALAERIKSKLADSKEYRHATEAKRYEMIRDMVTSAQAAGGGEYVDPGDSAIQDAVSSLGSGNAFSGYRQSMDPTHALIMAAQQKLKGSSAQLSTERMFGGGGRGMDLAAVRQAQRDAEKEMGSVFGEEAAGLMKSGSSQNFMKKYYALGEDEKKELRIALASGDMGKLPEELKSLIGQVPASEREGLLNAVQTGGEKGKAAFQKYLDAQQNTDKTAFKDTLDRAAEDAKNAAKEGGLSDAASKALNKFGEASSNLSAAMGTEGADVGAAGKTLQDAIAQGVAALSDPKATPAQKAAAQKAMAQIPAMQMAVDRSVKAKAALERLVGKSTSVKELMEKTGLSEDDVRAQIGKTGEDGKLTLDSAAAGRLEKSAASAAAGRGLAAEAGAQERKNAEKEQIIAFKTMTEALVHIAKHTGSGFKDPRASEGPKSPKGGAAAAAATSSPGEAYS